MFTGIIEEEGQISEIRRSDKSLFLKIRAQRVLEDTKVGDSIATNGVCLTVTGLYDDAFECDVMAQTMRMSNLGDLKKGDHVNLERAMALGERFGGHIVSGHIDGTGEILRIKREDVAVWVSIAAQSDILRHIVERGSVAIDGISLTVAYVDDKEFRVSLIPHTARETGLLRKRPGMKVNLENDIVGKYVEKLLKPEDNAKSSNLTAKKLAEYGFI